MDLELVKTRSLSGVVTLIARSFLSRGISTLGILALTTFLGRPEIGLFIAVNDLVSILGYFSDIGLAASLVQKKDQVTTTDLRTTFTIQQVIVLVLLAITLTFSPWLVAYYQISLEGTWLLYSLLAAFFLASLKTIPSIILERQLKFDILATVEILENIAFYVVAVVCAWRGLGIMSYVWAVLLRGVLGTGLIYYLVPWQIGLAFSIASLKSLLKFGVVYQVNSLIATVKDRFINIFLWKVIGADGVGIIGWAQTWSQQPLRFIMDNITRVTFPAYARMQDHPEQLRVAIEKTLFFISFLTLPILVELSLLSPILVQVVPKWTKWEPALIPLYIYCFNSAWACISTPLTNVLNALGQVKTNSYLMVMWTVLTWGLTPWLAIKFGFMGVAYATGIIALSSCVPVIIVQRLTHFRITSFGYPVFAALVMVVVGLLIPNNLILKSFIPSSVYLLVIYALEGQDLIMDIKKFYAALRKK